MKRKIWIVVGVLVLAGAWYAWHEYTRKPATAGDLDTAYGVTAEQLMKDFEDEKAASAKYLDKAVEVTGKISAVANNEKNVDISLETSDPMTAITVQILPSEKENAEKLTTGQQVTLKGICKGKLSDIELTKGIIVKN